MSVTPNYTMWTRRDLLVLCGEQFHKILEIKFQWKRIIKLPLNEKKKNKKKEKATTTRNAELYFVNKESTKKWIFRVPISKHWYHEEVIRVFSWYYLWTLVYEEPHQVNRRQQKLESRHNHFSSAAYSTELCKCIFRILVMWHLQQ